MHHTLTHHNPAASALWSDGKTEVERLIRRIEELENTLRKLRAELEIEPALYECEMINWIDEVLPE
jgi:sugar phosphate isomerase/epimerase